jgi:hypothetical protein
MRLTQSLADIYILTRRYRVCFKGFFFLTAPVWNIDKQSFSIFMNSKYRVYVSCALLEYGSAKIIKIIN